MMNLRRARKEDFKEYLRLKREEEKDYSKFVGKKVSSPRDSLLKKEFNNASSSKKHLILVVEEGKRLIGYIQGEYVVSPYRKWGYIEDVFVSKSFRRKGIASRLIRTFIKDLKDKGYKNVRLSVNTKHIIAIKLYKKLGFEISHYDLEKEWK